MNQPDLLDHNIPGRFELNEQMIRSIREMAKWGKLMSIVGGVGIVFMLFILVLVGTVFSGGLSQSNEIGPMSMLPIPLIMGSYGLIALFYGYPIYKLYKFSTLAKTAADNRDSVGMTLALKNLKSVFKFFGIITLIVLGLYAVMILIGLLGSAFSWLG